MPADALYDDDIVTAAQQQARVIGHFVRTQRERAPFALDARISSDFDTTRGRLEIMKVIDSKTASNQG